MTELITALDVDSLEEARQVVSECEACRWFKVGAQLFLRAGPDGAAELTKGHPGRIFLDLKFHDIPNTVANSARAAAAMGAALITVHAAGGRNMIAAAREAVEGTDTRILAVTVLTSMTDQMLRDEVGIPNSIPETVARFARMAVEAGAHGVVASPHEIRLVREAVGPDALVVIPGVRPTWAAQDDQARVMTPAEAARLGATHIVVGRPILKHREPRKAVTAILTELDEASR